MKRSTLSVFFVWLSAVALFIPSVWSMDGATLARLFCPYWRDAYGLAHRADSTALAPDEWQQTLALSVRHAVSALREVVDKVRFADTDTGRCTDAI